MSSNLRQVGTPQIRRPPVSEEDGPIPGVGLCLSGGGYRAMLFHLGSLWRLNEAGYFPKINRISSVSGGSIVAGMLALRWGSLIFNAAEVATNFEREVVKPLRQFADKTVDVLAVIVGALTPGLTINRQLARSYRGLFGESTLADLTYGPEFVFDATSLQSGDLWRFSNRSEGDWRVGTRQSPDTPLATVVAASSAFPPVLSPARLSFPPGALQPGSDPDVNTSAYRTRVVLSDGGVYDNLGLEAVWTRYKQVLISDAGGFMGNQLRPRALWPFQLFRVLHVIDNQVRDLRKRQAVLSFAEGQRTGTYWGIRSHVQDFDVPNPIAEPSRNAVNALAGVPTRLARVSCLLQEQLINWGYVMADTALRKHVDSNQPAGTLRYPKAGLGDDTA